VPERPRIRLAVAADVQAISDLTADAYRIYVERIGRAPAPMLADHAALVASGEVWVAELAGMVTGALVVREAPPALFLESVAVAPALQGQGIGRSLLEHAELLAAQRGLAAIELYTNARMTENLQLYPRLGYVEVARRQQDGYDRVFFRKPVPPAG
jgi:ribosomal protein S18 acetylase RimI-like enzyme